MRILGNILWIIFGGLLSALGWIITGILWCITIVGIHVRVQCFKLSSISLNPFGKQFFKIAGLSLRPFGAHVERTHYV